MKLELKVIGRRLGLGLLLLFLWCGIVSAALIDNGDGTVSDTETGLMWQQRVVDDYCLPFLQWQPALLYCEDLVWPHDGGYDDWRLPDRNELQSLVDFSRHDPCLDEIFFPKIFSSSYDHAHYWSSTTNFSYLTNNAMYVDFINGATSFTQKTYACFVRAVRSGPSGPFDGSAISVAPRALVFGKVGLGVISARLLEVKNQGDVDLVLGSLALSGTGADRFSITDNCSNHTIAPGESCFTEITFNPTMVGAVTAILEIPSNDPDNPVLEVPLRGTGDNIFSLGEALDNDSLTFTTGGESIYGEALDGGAWIGQDETSIYGGSSAQSGDVLKFQSSWMQATVTGPVDLSFSWMISSQRNGDLLRVYIDGYSPGHIQDEVGWSEKILDIPGGIHTVRWVFFHEACNYNYGIYGAWIDNVHVKYYSAISVDPDELDFGGVEVGDISVRLLEVKNQGDADLVLGSLALSGTGADRFSITDNCSNHTIAPGESCFTEITFNPTMVGAVTAILEIPSNDSDNPVLEVPLRGTGMTVLPGEGLDNDSLTFMTGGDAAWFDQDETWSYGGSSAQSGDVLDDQSSLMQVTVTGPVEFSFSWMISSEPEFDYLELYGDGDLMYWISGEVDWTEIILNIPDGIHTVRWEYSKDGSVSEGADAAWVDNVQIKYESNGNVVYVCNDNICNNNSPCYDSIHEAYLALSNGDEIKACNGLYLEDLVFNEGITFTLSGGWNNDYSDNTGYQSTLSGSLIITAGTVTVEEIVIEGTTALTKTKELRFGCLRPEYWSRWASLR